MKDSKLNHWNLRGRTDRRKGSGAIMSKHTQGPWKAEQSEDQLLILGAKRDTIAQVFSVHPDVQYDQANARLIAAAPEMLQLLYECDRYLRGDSEAIDFKDLRRSIGEAIAKAEGRES